MDRQYDMRSRAKSYRQGVVLSQNAVTALNLHNGLPWLCLLNVVPVRVEDLCGLATMVASH